MRARLWRRVQPERAQVDQRRRRRRRTDALGQAQTRLARGWRQADYLPPAVRTQQIFSQALAWVVSRGLQGRVNYEVGVASVWPYLRADGPPERAQGPL